MRTFFYIAYSFLSRGDIDRLTSYLLCENMWWKNLEVIFIDWMTGSGLMTRQRSNRNIKFIFLIINHLYNNARHFLNLAVLVNRSRFFYI